jgi:hypothetical protein
LKPSFNYKRATPTTTTTTTPSPPTPVSQEDEADYPYHFYLDFDDEPDANNANDDETNKKLKQQQQQDSSPEESLPVASSLLYPNREEEQRQLHQNNIWSDYYIKPAEAEDSSSVGVAKVPLSDLVQDNYTIPSLRDYKFPQFKPQHTESIQSASATATATTANSPASAYFPNYSEEDLENVADLDDSHVHYDHSKYFVKTKPRDVSSSVANLYNSFYYEPPSYSTKTVPNPVKAKFPLAHETDKLINFFTNSIQFNKDKKEDGDDDDDEDAGQERAVEGGTSPMTTIKMSSSTSTTTTSTPIPTDSPPAESILSPAKSLDNSIIIPSVAPPLSTTTDATSIPGMPGIDYPIFGEIPITDFDCMKQRYKGFFADTETKCQVK